MENFAAQRSRCGISRIHAIAATPSALAMDINLVTCAAQALALSRRAGAKRRRRLRALTAAALRLPLSHCHSGQNVPEIGTASERS